MNDDSNKPSAADEDRKLLWHRVKFLALIGVFLSPFIGGWVALYVFDLKPTAGNYGTLVSPVRKLDLPRLETLDGEVFEGGFGRRWTLLLFAGDDCAEQCRSNLFYMRQLRTLLGRDTLRLQNMLVTAAPQGETTRVYLRDFPNLKVLQVGRESALYEQFSLPGAEKPGSSAMLYLVDPEQNLMIYYPAENDPDLILQDIKKLLKLSQIG